MASFSAQFLMDIAGLPWGKSPTKAQWVNPDMENVS